MAFERRGWRGVCVCLSLCWHYAWFVVTHIHLVLCFLFFSADEIYWYLFASSLVVLSCSCAVSMQFLFIHPSLIKNWLSNLFLYFTISLFWFAHCSLPRASNGPRLSLSRPCDANKQWLKRKQNNLLWVRSARSGSYGVVGARGRRI